MRIFVLFASFLFTIVVHAQERIYTEPLKIPILISGSFAELRGNHFHSGIDIKTEGKQGLPVYSTMSGYISRIVVSSGGFGYALYIDHPNGTTSVYGHLQRFRNDVTEYVKNIQYKKESFKIDVPVPSDKFLIKKEELIAYSGNSGSSGGPHLHFEIRDTETQEPLNPLKLNFKIKDDISPKIQAIKIYPLNDSSHVNYSTKNKEYKIVYYEGAYHIKGGIVIPVNGEIGFAIQTTDYFNGTWSKCGINSLHLKVNGQELFTFEIDRFSFAETRYLNSHIDYGEYQKSKRRFIKTWKDAGNKLGFYGLEDERVNINDGQLHSIEITLKDSYENSSSLKFQVKGQYKHMVSLDKKVRTRFLYNQTNSYEAEGIKLECPNGAFYTDFDFDYTSFYTDDDSIKFSRIHSVHQKFTPIHKSINLSILAEGLPEELHRKALIARIDEKTGKLSSFGGNYEDGWVNASIRTFGNFVVAVDTVAPTIRSLSIRNTKTLTESSQIRFKIADLFSGIKSYRGTIDGKWALFEYDAKNSMLTYHFDNDRLELKKQHQIKLEVTDNKGNQSIYEGAFYK